MMATVSFGLSGSNLRSMGLSGSSGSPRASMTNGTSFVWDWRASLSPTAMPVMTAPVAERFIQLLKRSGSFPVTGPVTVSGPLAPSASGADRPVGGPERALVDRIRPRVGLHTVHGTVPWTAPVP